MDIDDWIVDGAWLRLPDGLIVQATLEKRDDAPRRVRRDRQGQRRFIFMDDGRVRAYVHEQVLVHGALASGAAPVSRIWVVPCDLVVEDLQRVTAPDG